MKKADVQYYADQINTFTICDATEKRNYITAIFPSGRKVAAYNEDSANELLKRCRDES